MRRYLYLLFVAIFAISGPSYAQTKAPEEMVTVPKSSLTPAQAMDAEQASLQARITTYGKWVGLGKEVGEAVNGSLAAVTEQTAKFADTKIGKIMTIVVVWKVIGRDITAMVFVTCLWGVVGTILTIMLFRSGLPRTVKETSTSKDGVTTTTYTKQDGDEASFGTAILGFVILLLISCIAIFGGG